MKKLTQLFFFFITINAFSQLPNTLSPADKVFGLSKFWQEVNYNFIYLDKIDRTMWDNRYKELITIVQNTKNDYEYYRELKKFCALLKDGHTNISFPKGIEEMNTMFGDYRFNIKNINDKAIIIRTNLSKKDEIPVGSEIIEVNGKPTQKYIEENVAPYISTSTDYILKDVCISNLLRGLENETYTIKIKKPNKKVIELTLTHKTTAEKEVYPAFEADKGLLDFKWLNDDIAYISLNSFADGKIVDLFIEKLPELNKAKSLVVDLRYNNGGNSAYGLEILKHLTNDTILYGSKTRSRLHIPSYKAWGKFFKESDTINNEHKKKSFLIYNDKYYYNFDYKGETIKLDSKRVVVPTTILIGHTTGSAAEDFLIYADNQKHMIKIGEKTNGSTGMPYLFDLPGGGSAKICTKQDTYPDGREFVGYGIIPDIEITPTLENYLNNKDVVLEKAIKSLKTKKPLVN